MNSALLWIGGLLIAAVSLLFAVPAIVDWNSFRGVFEEEASRILGRDVRVGGKVNLRLLPAPYVRFEKVRISDTDASLGEPFFRTESFTMWLSAMPLLRGALEANEIELDRPVLRLAVGPDGTGNWQSLRRSTGALPFVPSDVVLQQIRIRNGTVSLKSAERQEPVELTGIDGQLSATALSGPYRFRGNIDWGGSARELRVATAPQDDAGRLRVRVNLRVPETGNSYTFDGGLSELTTRAKVDGTLTARLPIATAQRTQATPAQATPNAGNRPPAAGNSDANAFDLQAAVLGDLDGVKLSDINVAFEQDGKPQLVSGTATVSWRRELRLETQLASRWLDLDRIASDGASRPLEAMRELIERIGAVLPVEGTTFATLDVDQVNLGGEALSGLRLALARVAGHTSIGELKAGLPGNARASVRGILGAGGDPKAFEGELVLRGSSYQRFSAWASNPGASTSAASNPGQSQATPAASQPPSKGDGAFSLASRLKMLPGRLDLSDASVEFAGAQLQGDLEWTWTGQKELRLSIDGTTVDVSALAPGLLDFESWRGARRVQGEDTQSETQSSSPLAALGAKARLVNAAVGNLRLKVRAQNVTDGTNTLRDVDADLSFEPDALIIPGLKFVSQDGVVVDVQGDIKALESKPTGRLKGWLSARNGASAQALAAALSSGAGPGHSSQVNASLGNSGQGNWAARVSRVELGFAAVLGDKSTNQLTLRANGTLDDGHVDLALELGGGLNAWRSAPIDLALHIESPEMPNLVRRIVSGREPAPIVVGADSAQGTLVLKAVGTSAAALTTYAQLDLNGLGLGYSGRASVAADDGLDLAGEVSVVAADAADLATLVGANRRPLLPGIGVDGTLTVTRTAGLAVLETHSLAIGASRVSGQLKLASKDDRLAIDGQLTASQASIPALLGLVLDGREVAGTAERRDDTGSPWSDTAFALGVLDNVAGRIAVATPSLQLTGDLAVSDADMVFDLEPGRVTLSKLTGSALGGRLTARSMIERATAGANVTIDGEIRGARLGELVVKAKPKAGDKPQDLGEADIALELAGRGLSPRAVIAVMTGTGEVELRNARVRGMTPTAIDKSAQVLIEGQDDINRTRLEQVVRGALAGSDLALPAGKLPIQVVDGVVKVGALQTETADARIRNLTTVDLGALKLDSDWQITPLRAAPARPGAAAKGPLPPVSLAWSGPLGRLPGIEPRLSIETLEREITMRRVERDVERLEELRRQDEQRARQETDRLRRIDDAARGPGAGASQGPPVIQAPFLIQPPRPAASSAPAGPPR